MVRDIWFLYLVVMGQEVSQEVYQEMRMGFEYRVWFVLFFRYFVGLEISQVLEEKGVDKGFYKVKIQSWSLLIDILRVQQFF